MKLPDEFSVLPSKNTVDDEKTPGQRGGNQKRTIILSALGYANKDLG